MNTLFFHLVFYCLVFFSEYSKVWYLTNTVFYRKYSKGVTSHNCIISSHSAGSHETNKATLHNTWGCDHT